MMNKRGISAAGIVILLSLLAVSCTFESVEGSGSFAYDLRGLWVSTEETEYSGTLKIAYDTIIITGYDSNQTPPQGDDDERPFKGYFIEGIEHEGYSEDKKIFIKRNDWQAGISYDYFTSRNGQDKFLEFPTWGETLQKRSFASDLHGTWESDNPSLYSGTIKITDDTITITNYTSAQSYPYRPFDGYFIRGTIHAGYSDSSHIFIEKDKDSGWQPGVSYTYIDEDEGEFLEFGRYGSTVERFRRKSY